MAHQEALFDLVPERPSARRGRLRHALEADIARARRNDVTLAAAGVAQLRILADSIDDLDVDLRGRRAKPYDRVPLTQLARQFDDTYAVVFASVAVAADPFLAALDEFRRTEASDTSHAEPPNG